MMLKSSWKVLVNCGELAPVFALGAIFLYFAFIILGIPVVYEALKILYQCQVGDCNKIESAVSVGGTFFVILTLIITILSLISSNAKYRSQLSKMDAQHYEQMNLMNGQIRLVIQNNRMAILKEYLISLLINENIDSGIMIDREIGIIIGWTVFKLKLNQFTFRFRWYFPEKESADNILKNRGWHECVISLYEISKDSYVMSGYSMANRTYSSIEKIFHDMSNSDYDNIIRRILILTFSNEDNFKEYNENLKKYEKHWNEVL